jgi:hypothetical protein
MERNWRCTYKFKGTVTGGSLPPSPNGRKRTWHGKLCDKEKLNNPKKIEFLLITQKESVKT